MAGSTLGKRANYQYTSDSGTQYAIKTLATLGTAAGLTPLSSAKPSLPRGFKPRVIHCEATIGGALVRKNLIVDSSNAKYNTDAGSTINIDGSAFIVTGRRGEKTTFPVLAVQT